ncbi:MAG: hypothetical protein ABIL62_17625 [Planctomycetota bacterium]
MSGHHTARRIGHSDDKQFSLSTKREGLTLLWADKAKWLFTKLFVLDLPWKALYHRLAHLMLKSTCVIRRRIDGLPTGVAVAVARLE